MHTRPTLEELLSALRRKMVKSAHEARLRDELTMSEFSALWHIAGAKQTTMESLADALGIKPPSATALIGALQRKKLVSRTHDTRDRRVVVLRLTPTAARKLSSFQQKKQRAFEELFGVLSEADRRTLVRILAKLVAN